MAAAVSRIGYVLRTGRLHGKRTIAKVVLPEEGMYVSGETAAGSPSTKTRCSWQVALDFRHAAPRQGQMIIYKRAVRHGIYQLKFVRPALFVPWRRTGMYVRGTIRPDAVDRTRETSWGRWLFADRMDAVDGLDTTAPGVHVPRAKCF